MKINMKIIKYILGVILGIVILSFGYTYLFTVKAPQECLEYKRVYDEVVQLLEPLKNEPQLASTYESLVTTGKYLDEVLSDNQRFDKSKAEGLKLVCIKQKQATQQILEFLKTSIANGKV